MLKNGIRLGFKRYYVVASIGLENAFYFPSFTITGESVCACAGGIGMGKDNKMHRIFGLNQPFSLFPNTHSGNTLMLKVAAHSDSFFRTQTNRFVVAAVAVPAAVKPSSWPRKKKTLVHRRELRLFIIHFTPSCNFESLPLPKCTIFSVPECSPIFLLKL